MNRNNNPDQRDASEAPESIPAWTRSVVSVLLVYHLLTIFVGPFTFSTSIGNGIASPFAEKTISWFEQGSHLDFAYLNHGYYFFAPDPGPSHLIEYQAVFPKGDARRPVVARSPDLKVHWPRLLYHRHFMLTEWIHNTYVPAQPPMIPADDAPMLAEWQNARKMYERTWASYEQHLLHKHGAESVNMAKIEHRPPMLFERLEQRLPLDDPSLYEVLLQDPPMDDRP